MLSAFCRVVPALFALAYLLAVALLAASTFGLFGVEPDPLSGVYVILLGQPWVRFVDATPEVLSPWLAAGAPIVNLVLLMLICKVARRRTV